MKLFAACILFLYLYGKVDGQLDCGNIEKDLMFILDESGSINNGVFNNFIRTFLVDLVGCYNLSTDAIQMSLTTFATGVTGRYGLDTYNDDVAGAQTFISTFARVPSSQRSQTRTDLALQFVRENIIGSAADRADVPNCLVIITDGGSTAPLNTLQQNDLIQPLVDETFVLGFGSMINETELDILASEPLADHKFLALNGGALSTFKDIFAAVPCPPCDPDCLNNGFCVRENQTCECNENYTGDICETRIC